jgi:hypothetical protein
MAAFLLKLLWGSSRLMVVLLQKQTWWVVTGVVSSCAGAEEKQGMCHLSIATHVYG